MKRKNHFLAMGLIGLLMALPACSQKIEVPAAVQKAFDSKFPTASKVKWSKESDTEFEAEFRLANEEASANFMQNGSWVETEKEISKKSLPQAVISTLDKEFASFKTDEVALTETAKGESFYEIEVKKGKEELILHISANGKVLKKESGEEEEDEEGEDKD